VSVLIIENLPKLKT